MDVILKELTHRFDINKEKEDTAETVSLNIKNQIEKQIKKYGKRKYNMNT